MLAIQGYYDGAVFQPLEKNTAKLNQKVIITIMDDFVEKPKMSQEERVREAENKSLIGIGKGKLFFPDDIDFCNDEVADLFYGSK
ncbi:MAG: hypothetical protein IKN43_09210 [Selenomonadaceae bacterium]|nr:hypothetical protein [Selenomonadaceae bacterium]